MGRVENALAALKIAVAEEKRGRLWAKCPYHNPDLHPSWCVRVTKERYGQHYCFACKAGGHLVQLVEHVLKLDRDAADAWLLQHGAEEPAPEPEPMPELLRFVTSSLTAKRFRLPAEVIVEPMADWVTPARRYAERRGITAGQVHDWGIGYAVDGRLAGRIVLPSFDWGTGLPASYTARTFAGDPKRYLYPSGAFEHPNLDVMFGELHWPEPALRRSSTVVVVEGALNALAVERATAGEMVYLAALGGSKVRPMFLGKLAAFGDVLVLTDSDDAGDQAAAELTAGLVRYARTRRVRLPPGKDACEVSPEELCRWVFPPKAPRS